MVPVIKNTIYLSVILLLLLCAHAVSAEQENIPFQHLTLIYNAIKAHKVALLEGNDIFIQSEKADNILKADVYAITQSSIAELYKALSKPENWCEFVPLHLNVKSCTYTEGPHPTVTFYAGRKIYKAPEDTYELEYHFRVTEHENDRFKVQLTAEDGPYGTSNYIIALEIISLDSEALLHMCLSYRTSFISRSATLAYLSTIGRDKVGFSIAEENVIKPVYVKGVRGIIERNVMRYFLALSIYLDTLNLDSSDLFNQRAEEWYELTDQYATQLHELEKEEYMEAKRKEHINQEEMQRQINQGFEKYDTDTTN